MILVSIRDAKLIKKIGEATALEVRATGIPYAFAPCIAVIKQHHVKLIVILISKSLEIDVFLMSIYYCFCRYAEIRDGDGAMKAIVRTIRLFKQ